MELLISLIVRTVIGLPLASFLGLVGYFVAWMLWPPDSGLFLFITILTVGVGFGAGLGSGLAWLRLDERRNVTLAFFGLALSGGLLGAWGGLMYDKAANEQVLVSVVPVTAIAGAGVVSNVPPLLISVFSTWRKRRL